MQGQRLLSLVRTICNEYVSFLCLSGGRTNKVKSSRAFALYGDNWETLPRMASGKRQVACALQGNHIYVLGGGPYTVKGLVQFFN